MLFVFLKPRCVRPLTNFLLWTSGFVFLHVYFVVSCCFTVAWRALLPIVWIRPGPGCSIDTRSGNFIFRLLPFVRDHRKTIRLNDDSSLTNNFNLNLTLWRLLHSSFCFMELTLTVPHPVTFWGYPLHKRLATRIRFPSLDVHFPSGLSTHRIVSQLFFADFGFPLSEWWSENWFSRECFPVTHFQKMSFE